MKALNLILLAVMFVSISSVANADGSDKQKNKLKKGTKKELSIEDFSQIYLKKKAKKES